MTPSVDRPSSPPCFAPPSLRPSLADLTLLPSLLLCRSAGIRESWRLDAGNFTNCGADECFLDFTTPAVRSAMLWVSVACQLVLLTATVDWVIPVWHRPSSACVLQPSTASLLLRHLTRCILPPFCG
jgi:hypothetical protein